jgi:hypothetical protein
MIEHLVANNDIDDEPANYLTLELREDQTT